MAAYEMSRDQVNSTIISVCELKDVSDLSLNPESSGKDEPKHEDLLGWPLSKRLGHVITVSVLSMISNIAATMVAPVMASVMDDFKTTNINISSLTVNIYFLGFALSPLVIPSLSEMYGRLPIYHTCNFLFVAFIIAGSLSKTAGQFIAFRLLAGCAGAAPLTIGGGTLADVNDTENCGFAFALFALGPVLGPIIGPILGGLIKDWRGVFWTVAAMASTASTWALFYMEETHPNTIRRRKASEEGKPGLERQIKPPEGVQGLAKFGHIMKTLFRPVILLIFSPVVLLMSLYSGLVLGCLYLLFSTFPMVFNGWYNFSSRASSFLYFGPGFGSLLGLFFFWGFSERIVQARTKAQAKKAQKIASQSAPDAELTMDTMGEKQRTALMTNKKPENKLILMIWSSPLIPAGLFIYGWTAYHRVHWIVPILGTSIVGLGSFFIVLPSQLYLVEIHGSEAAASALGATIICRMLFAAFLPLAGPHLYSYLHYGWGNALLAFIVSLFAVVPVVFYRYGETIRLKTPITL